MGREEGREVGREEGREEGRDGKSDASLIRAGHMYLRFNERVRGKKRDLIRKRCFIERGVKTA